MADGGNGDFPRIRQLLEAVPRFSLAHLPTPLERISGVELSAGMRLFVKRDDCTGLALGGNKTRKLEFAIGHALSLGARTIVTGSGLQSNHIRQTAAAAAKAGLAFHAVVAPVHESFPRIQIESGNLLLDGIFGASFHVAPDEGALEEVTEEIFARLKSEGEKPYLIPLGASDGIGALGYVECALEVLEQCSALGVEPAAIFTATGSGGTQAGLLAGLRLLGVDLPVIGISVSDASEVKREKVRTCIVDIEKTLGRTVPISEADIVVHDAYAGDGYSMPTSQANRWIKKLARSDGLLLDPVYTGKAFAGMIDLLRPGVFGAGDAIFLHTGGTPALFASGEALWRPEADAPEIEALYARTGGGRMDAFRAERIA